MKKLLSNIISTLILLQVNPVTAQRKICIDADWKFFYGDGSVSITVPQNSEQWRTLDLPHDWSVETEAATAAGGTVIGPFSTNSVGKFQTGNTVGGEGWYEKKINISAADLKGQVSLYFEGAYNQTEVWINGKKAYFNAYGYSSFQFNVTNLLNEGENILLVRVVNDGNNTRWYAGSGIYRHVWLIRTPSLYMNEWDTYICPDGKNIQVQTCLYNESPVLKTGNIAVDIVDAEGNVVATAQQRIRVDAENEMPVALSLELSGATLWSLENPYLYRAVFHVTDEQDSTVDKLTKRFGIRTLEFTAEQGFLLNGKKTLLRGGCVHHDNGLLGAAAYDRAEERKLQLLKEQGYNAVRCSHNIPSEHFLDVCDSIGLLVIDETFDQWYVAKNDGDYHRFFAEFSERDLATMLRRDRNHPSIIMWSIGNEIPGRIEPAGIAVAKRMKEIIKKYDSTRPVTAAICGWDAGDAWNSASHNWSIQSAKAFLSLEVGGYNYLYDKYESDHSAYPTRIMYGAESYPKQMFQNWDLVEKHPYVIGDFVWTAMDYLGEAGIGSASIRNSGNQSMFQNWPWYNGWCGDIDLIGQKKPQSYYHDVVWRRAPITMAVERPIPSGYWQSISAWGWQLEEQNWTYPDLDENDRMTINVYSRAPKVRLYLNGENLGEKEPGNTYWAGFYIPYKPGTLRAVNLNGNGEEIENESFELQTTGQPHKLRLTADREHILSDGQDLAYVTIELIDEKNRVIVSECNLKIELEIQGEGKLLAGGNASPTDQESFRSETPRLYRGRALAILKSNKNEGTIKLTVKAEGLPEEVVVIKTTSDLQGRPK